MTIRRTTALTVALLVIASLASAHDLFLKFESYFLQPRSTVRVPMLNGTFTKSEGFVSPARLADVSLVSSVGRVHLSADSSVSRGPDSASVLSIAVGHAGTYVLGVATRPNEIALGAEDFNSYLKEDGLPDVLEARRRANELDRGAHERYSKHVKAVFQVGERRTNDFGVVLGYAAEIVPLDNPYALASNKMLRVRCLVDGKPVRSQMVLWGGEKGGQSFAERSTRTDSAGVAVITPDQPGRWYVKFISMVRASEAGLDYESKWATLTFEIR